ncbi:MAG: hypothetical protein JW844_08735 [Candidatus Omnitrophica bacterium]|nr:hypothetical protein [Candidatus Omnitrophota bacterium]
MDQHVKIQEDVKRFWDETRDYLKKIGVETSKIAKRGEEEVMKASKIARLHLDIVTLNLKKERLYKEIGKKAVFLSTKNKLSAAALKKPCADAIKVEEEVAAKQREIKKETEYISRKLSGTKTPRKKTASRPQDKGKTKKR